MQVEFKDLTLVHLELPYIPEYLAFREVGFLVEAVSKLRRAKPHLLPQIILVDGNGMLHPRGFGIACHLGVLTDIPTVGVAKTLFHVDGIEKHADEIKNCLKSSGDSFPLEGDSGTIWGMALRSTQQSHNPIYISVGHKTGLETAVRLAHACCQYRIPEPIRQADIRSRAYIKEHIAKELETCSCRLQNDESNLLKEEDDRKKEGQDLVHETCQNFDQLNLS